MISLSPGQGTLSTWKSVLRGEPLRLAPSARPRIASGADAIGRILAKGAPVYGINTGFGKLASVTIPSDQLAELQRRIVISHASGIGATLPKDVTRLMMALKLASLGHGVSGVRVETIALLEAMLEKDIVPIVPEQGSVGASGDLAPLAHLACAMIGVGEVHGQKSAARALADAGLKPATLGPKEGLALLNGTQFSTACALAAAVNVETLLQSAIVAGAMSTDGAKGTDAPFDARIHAVRGHAGQIEVAAALRELLAGSQIRESHRLGDDRVQDPYCLRCMPQVLGAVLDIARDATKKLLIEANGVSDNPLIFPETDDALSGGNFHAEPIAFAADILAIAICEIGSMSERRTAMLIDPTLSALPAFLVPNPGLNSGFMVPQVAAAALVSENKQSAMPASVDSIPTSANQEDHVSMAAHAARRLERMASNATHVVAIEALSAAQACDLRAPLRSSKPLEAAKSRLRQDVAMLADDRFMAPDLANAFALVSSGEFAAAAGISLPGIVS